MVKYRRKYFDIDLQKSEVKGEEQIAAAGVEDLAQKEVMKQATNLQNTIANAVGTTAGIYISQEISAEVQKQNQQTYNTAQSQNGQQQSQAQLMSKYGINSNNNSAQTSASAASGYGSGNTSATAKTAQPIISDGYMLTSLGIDLDDPTLALLGATSPDAQSLISQSVATVATGALLNVRALSVGNGGGVRSPSFNQSILDSFVDELHDVMTYVSPALDKISEYGERQFDKYTSLYKSNLSQGLDAWAKAEELGSTGPFGFASVAEMYYQKALTNEFLANAAKYGYLKYGSQLLSGASYAGISYEFYSDYEAVKAAPPGVPTDIVAVQDFGGTVFGTGAGLIVAARSDNLILGGLAAYSMSSFWKGLINYTGEQLFPNQHNQETSEYRNSM